MIHKAYLLCLLKKELLPQLYNKSILFMFELNIFECLLFLCVFLNFLKIHFLS